MAMFGKKPPPIRTLVGVGTVVRGELKFSEGLRVDGEVEGDVIACGDARSILVIGEKACVRGRVRADHVIINGQVFGPVQCDEVLELQPRARVSGDIRYQSLEMHPGAAVNGQLQPMNGETVEDDKPTLLLASSEAA